MSDNGAKPNFEKMYNELLLRYNSLVKAVQKLELDKGAVEQERDYFRQQLLNAEQNIAQQKTNLVNVVTTNNQTQQEMAQEIQGLRSELRKFDGDNHRLGN